MALVLDSPVPAGIWSGYGREMLNGLLGYSVCSRPDTYQCSYPDWKAVSLLSLPCSIFKTINLREECASLSRGWGVSRLAVMINKKKIHSQHSVI
jgi:hypothetical protein